MASIQRRGNTYRFRVSCGFDTEGKRVFKTMTFTPQHKEGTKAYEKEIDDAARDFERRVKEGSFLDGEHLTYKDVTLRWLENRAKKKSPSGRQKLSDGGESYLAAIERYAYPAFGSMKIAQIQTIHIQNLVDELERRGLSPAYIKRIFVAINSVFRYAKPLKLIKENPCSDCELPMVERDTALHYFTKDQAMTFLNKALTMEYKDTIRAHSRIDDTGKEYFVREYTEIHLIPLQFRVLYSLLVFGGFRRGEIAALTWRDIDFNNRSVSINKAAAARKAGTVIKSPKTSAGIRTVTLPSSCFDLLRRWKTEEKKIRISLGSAWQGADDFEDANIFIQSTGKMIDLNTIGHKFREILERYNRMVDAAIKEGMATEQDKLPLIRLHDLRHTSATLLIGSGCDIETVSKRLGHSKASVTLDVYAHPLEENDYTAAQMLDKMIALEA